VDLNRTVQIRGAANFSGVVEPLFVLDGMTVSKDAIINIPPSDVEAVDILKGAAASIYGSQGGGGVIAILTKRGGSTYDWSKESPEGTLVTKIMGYNPVREFYAPKYDKPEADHVRPDFRPTLFWAPMVQTDKDGKSQSNLLQLRCKNGSKYSGGRNDGSRGVGRRDWGDLRLSRRDSIPTINCL
jgi:TonB-dependent SusC/RagA subfamily outer membrane receptor